jgi:hypothetical protein
MSVEPIEAGALDRHFPTNHFRSAYIGVHPRLIPAARFVRFQMGSASNLAADIRR